ncbi:hypothetical protein AKJ65_00285 [candidate division MSBL1 archaeon SCGC-AAA259E19]|uniref:Carbamoyltransferase n=1 Tax=candidate division MSBL1 archaeon SCGC-AAA259E19 TaxID=1698264 RepID=A0A133UNV1_9EURY|nr:hypothetical protein AKJ65_00285 [candidate division MSBL1 archaeon SCGC-AAA259E19]
MPDHKQRAEILVQGIVQGVGFRPFIYRLADEIELSGSVKNLGDAGVEIILEGPKEKIRNFLNNLREKSPPLSEIQSIDVNYSKPQGIEGFEILESAEGGEGSGTIPPDTAMCDNCLEDMRDPESRYHGYWATSCVDCGPRFTVIRGLPYDRPKTSMEEFPMCDECRAEYEDPLDRRHHAQTIACPNCGPQLFSVPGTENPIEKTAEALQEGQIAAIRGVGGTHLACDAYNDEAVIRLMRRLKRLHKPLAIMARDLEMIEDFAKFSEEEQEILKSIKRPIVILDQIEGSPLSTEISEGLHNVGVMLPYTGVHYLLFDYIDFPVVMTSANLTGRPMLIENESIISELDEIADFMLLHDRKIVARCDDSVVRFSGGTRRFLRRSRGWAPSPIPLDLGEEPILALGAEFDNTIALYDDGNCYVSQHIGDVDDLETMGFLEETVDHLTNITNVEMPDKVACDLHPDFMTTELAEGMSDEPIRIQHHHSHLASILGEREIEEVIGIAADGIGYGPDGTVWGGEILYANASDFKRVGSLSKMLMPGGDKASQYPARMIAGIFYDSSDLPDILEKHARFPGGDEEREMVEEQVRERFNSPKSTSAGRTLAAASSLLDICQERTYEGEPAMKLESVAIRGTPLDVSPKLEIQEGRPVLSVQSMMRDLIDLKEKGEKREDIAATAQNVLAEGLAKIAIRQARELELENVAFTGGVAYNDAIGRRVREMIEGSGLVYVTNEKLPCGDGGVSFGQLIVASEFWQ